METFAIFCKDLATNMPHRAGEFRQAATAGEQGRGQHAAGDVIAALRKELDRIRHYEDAEARAADLTLAEHIKQAREKLSAAWRSGSEFAKAFGKPFLTAKMKMAGIAAKAATWIRPVRDAVETAGNFVWPGVGTLVARFPNLIVQAAAGARGLIRDRKEIAEKAKVFGKKAREAKKALAPVVAEGIRRAAAKVRAGAARVGDALRSGAELARAAACHVGAAIQRGAIAVAGRVGGWLKAVLG